MANIISFYSYKGGVGRSMLLANVAVVLAQRKRRVVCIDFDLEAGGLHTIFGIEPKDIRSTTLDLLLANGAATEALDLSARLAPGSFLRLLPTVSEIALVNAVFNNFQDLPTRLDGIIRDLDTLYAPDYVLIDSRAGFAEFAAPPLALAQQLVCVLRPNRQNVDGVRTLLDLLAPLRRPPQQVLIVVSQVPELPQTREVLRHLATALGPGRNFKCEIPLALELALEERLAVLEMPESRLAASYSRVADLLERPQ